MTQSSTSAAPSTGGHHSSVIIRISARLIAAAVRIGQYDGEGMWIGAFGGPATSTLETPSQSGSRVRISGSSEKLYSGGGDVVAHSSVCASHGLFPAIWPFFRLRITFQAKASTPSAVMNPPIEMMWLIVPRFSSSA